jgi:predicted transcriptional regulator
MKDPNRAGSSAKKSASPSRPKRAKPKSVDTSGIKPKLDYLHDQSVAVFNHGLMHFDDITVIPGEPVVPLANPPLHPTVARFLTTYRGAVKVPVTGYSCLVVAGDRPTLCSEADPVLPTSLLPAALRAVRRLNNLPQGTTIHWVGDETGIRNRCPHYPDAPYAAPFDKERWASVVAAGGRPRATPETKGASGSGSTLEPTEVEELTDDEFAIFDELNAHSAFGENRRRKANEIAEGVNRKIGERRFSEMLSSLVKRGYLNVKQGRHDPGYFLTKKGRASYQEFQESKRRKP